MKTKNTCAWCQIELGTVPSTTESFDAVFSHGICLTCKEKMEQELADMKSSVEKRHSLVAA